VAPSDAAILLNGESGAGKNVLARAIHAWSGRRAAPFMTIPCAALADTGTAASSSGACRARLRAPARTRPIPSTSPVEERSSSTRSVISRASSRALSCVS
jgi:hypothetical protein